MKHRVAASEFFSEEEKGKIEATIRDVESRTIGEVVVMVVDSSALYEEAQLLGGILLGGVVSLVLSVLFFHSSIWYFIPMSFILFFPSQWIVKNAILLKALLIGKGRKEDAVRRRAISAFHEHGLYKTRKNTGVLFLLSLLERRVWILADKGLHEKIGQESLDQSARLVSQGIREGRSCDALREAIRRIGELLSRHFPITPGDINELPDQVITEDADERARG